MKIQLFIYINHTYKTYTKQTYLFIILIKLLIFKNFFIINFQEFFIRSIFFFKRKKILLIKNSYLFFLFSSITLLFKHFWRLEATHDSINRYQEYYGQIMWKMRTFLRIIGTVKKLLLNNQKQLKFLRHNV